MVYETETTAVVNIPNILDILNKNITLNLCNWLYATGQYTKSRENQGIGGKWSCGLFGNTNVSGYLTNHNLTSMETFIAFFDVLGFKEFIYNNDLKEIKRLFEYLLRDSQTAVSGGKNIQSSPSTIVPDLKHQKVNCLHISDSIIFWTNSNTEQDFKELVNVCYSFYWQSLKTTFPLRGCLTYGEIDFNPSTIKNEYGVTFFNYSLIGKGLVDAFTKAETIEYAGCVLDILAIEKVSDQLINNLIYEKKICMYNVPSKIGINYELVFRPINGDQNDVSFRNNVNTIKSLFTYASKSNLNTLPKSVKNKMNNTIDFIRFFKEASNDIKPE